jgi:hypothetical protein
MAVIWLTDQLVKKVILSVDMLLGHDVKLQKSVRQRRGDGGQKAACPFAGIIQIKFERYDLRTSSRAARHVCLKTPVLLLSRNGHAGLHMSLNTRHACFRLRKYLSMSRRRCLTMVTHLAKRRGGAPQCFLHGIVPEG